MVHSCEYMSVYYEVVNHPTQFNKMKSSNWFAHYNYSDYVVMMVNQVLKFHNLQQDEEQPLLSNPGKHTYTINTLETSWNKHSYHVDVDSSC